MFHPRLRPLLISVVLSAPAFCWEPDEANGLPSIAEQTAGMSQVDGYFRLFRDDVAGKVWLQIERWDNDFLYASGLSSGLGSNPVGLDRGQWGKSRVVRFLRVGRRVFLVEQNVRYRAVSDDAGERKAVDDSFADSVLWAADVAAETDDAVLVDATSLLIRDAHDVVGRLKSTNQGSFSLDKGRSFVSLDRCRSFPTNTELQATLTFTSSKPGPLVNQTAADGGSFSIRLHHSLVKLPGPGYRPRRADPRVGAFHVAYADFATPLDEPLTQRFITRHRLEKRDPDREQSPPVKPITYYLDPGTPQPVRDALLEGARWWADAFEEAGFTDAFHVRMLPDGVDPMDARYNVIQWVHRSTRGWSYGQSIVDPRTGEIIKGHVLLGSLRVRQDRLLIDGVTSAAPPPPLNLCSCCGIAGAGADHALALLDDGISPLEVSLARLRQLSAHEVGHTLGFAHNFAASTYGDRASVMDYPAPRVKFNNGDLDLSDAYGVGVGSWDRFMVRYAYSTFAGEAAEAKGLDELVRESQRQGLHYLSDADARPAGAAHPRASLWDNGEDAVAELRHVMRVRRRALDKLGPGDLLPQQPLADLEIVLVPIFLYHRYQVAATAKLIGGFEYRYAKADEDDVDVVAPVPVERQRQALDELLKTLDADALVIPERLLRRLPPKPYFSLEDRERFTGRTAMIFDPSAAARVAAEQTLDQLLQPHRAARLAAYPQPDWELRSVLDKIISHVAEQPLGETARSREVQRVVQHVLVDALIQLADSDSTSETVRATVTERLQVLALRPDAVLKANALGIDHMLALKGKIDRYLNRPHIPARKPSVLPPPPGSPIGRGF